MVFITFCLLSFLSHSYCKIISFYKIEPSTSKNRARASESQAGDVPERYYVVENNEMVRIKYLLVYCEPTTTHRERFDFMYSRN